MQECPYNNLINLESAARLHNHAVWFLLYHRSTVSNISALFPENIFAILWEFMEQGRRICTFILMFMYIILWLPWLIKTSKEISINATGKSTLFQLPSLKVMCPEGKDRAIFVWPWNENARTKQRQQTNGNRAIWLVYPTDTNAPGFWLAKRTLARVNKLHARRTF